MKHIFIVNAGSGKGRAAPKFIPKIKEYLAKHRDIDGEIYITKFAGDGMQYVEKCSKTGEKIRFYACGGDGTLYEVVNGSYKYPNTEIAVIPLGSGNDFIRILGKKEDLVDIDSQVNGTVTEFDLIKAGNRVAINQCSMGLDAEICAKQAATKKIPGVNGEFAYTVALFYCLMRRLKSEFKVTIDDSKVIEGTMLFSLCANSRWYGGGYKGAPKALPDDGLLDCIIVKKTVGRLKLVGLVNQYKRGEHLSWDFTNYTRGKKMHIESKKPAAVNVDGECEYVTEATFEILEKAARVVIPTTSNYFENRKNDTFD